MKLAFSKEDEAFRDEAAQWLTGQMEGDFADIRGQRGLIAMAARRKEWEKRLADHKWSCIGWPAAWGGRDASLMQQVIFAEEYARAGAPGRVGHLGVELVGPTLMQFGADDQKRRFLPDIAAGKSLWCQGYSEPNAGSDLANVSTKARLDPDTNEWIVDGQKVWTSLAQISDWIFIVARTEEGTRGPKGLTFILMPLDAAGIDIRPIKQINGEAEFNEVFFDGARTAGDNIVSEPGDGWRVAMGLLGFERGVSTLGQQMAFRQELDAVVFAAKTNGAAANPLFRQRIAEAEIGLRLMRYGALRMLSQADPSAPSGAALTYKIQWASWRRKLGELAIDILGSDGLVSDNDDYRWDVLTDLFLTSRADTIYGGTNQIQRNIIAERALGMPREPRGDR